MAVDLNNVLAIAGYSIAEVKQRSKLKQKKSNENGMDKEEPTIMHSLFVIFLLENKPAKMATVPDNAVNMKSSVMDVTFRNPYPAKGLITINRNRSKVIKRRTKFEVSIDAHKSTPAAQQ